MILFSVDRRCMIRALSNIKHGKELIMSRKGLRLIHPVSKRDQVVASFKEAILSGIIQPGEAIRLLCHEKPPRAQVVFRERRQTRTDR
jgi:hypothetical protein